MTIADRTTPSQRPSWLARLRGTGAVASLTAASVPTHKPLEDMADLLVMSTVDQKVPAEAPGSADVLDALIKENQPEPSAADIAPLDEPLEIPAEPEAAVQELSNEARVNLLQREIETLLRDTPEIADDAPPPAPWPEDAISAISPMPIGEPPIEIPHETQEHAPEQDAVLQESAEAESAAVSAEELDVLLEREFAAAADEIRAAASPATNASVAGVPPAEPESPPPALATAAPPAAELPVKPAAAVAAPPAAEATPTAPSPAVPAPAEAVNAAEASGPQSAASISEKIFAEQLDRLMASSAGNAAEPPAAMPTDEAHEKLTEAEGVLAEELAQLISESAATPAATVSPTAAAQPAAPGIAAEQPGGGAIAGETVGAVSAAAPIAAPAEGATTAPGATAAGEAVAGSAEDAAAPARTPGKGIVARLRRLGEGIVLMMLQLIDLPFGWISELDKNIIGVAALLLLLGGAVLYVMSRYM